MIPSVINITENTNRISNILKAKYGFKNKSETINFVVNSYGSFVLVFKYIKSEDKGVFYNCIHHNNIYL